MTKSFLRGLFNNTLVFLSLGSAVFWIAIIAWNASLGNPLSYNVSEFVLDVDVFEAGDVLTFDVARCSKKNLEYSFDEFLVEVRSGEVVAVSHGKSDVKKGCEVIRSIPKVLPHDLSPGVYRYDFEVYVRGTFKNYVMVGLSTEEFTVE